MSGTPAYMAPEQFEGKPATIASDVYAVGLILFEIWSGRRIFSGKSLTEIIAQHHSDASRESLKSAVEMDRSIVAVIEKCLAPNPVDRPTSRAPFSQLCLARMRSSLLSPRGRPRRQAWLPPRA